MKVGFLVDPVAKTVVEVGFDGYIWPMLEMIDATMPDCVTINESMDTMYLDRYASQAPRFRFDGKPHIGKALLVGIKVTETCGHNHEKGGCWLVEPRPVINYDDFKKRIKF